MISREIYQEEINKGAFSISLVKDAVVATVNEKNPNINIILKTGLTKEKFKELWIENKIKTWNEILNYAGKDKVNVYTRSDSCGAGETWAKYFQSKQEDLKGVGVYGDPGLAEAVKKDNLGIGYNNINYAYDPSSKKPIEGIKICPIDLNNNGNIEPEENFYDTRDAIIDAIIKDKYPSPPARILYFVTKGKPENEALKKFLEWVLTKGQDFVQESGYINLNTGLINEELKRIK
jgi:phosphate transport system substrate-binding protein